MCICARDSFELIFAEQYAVYFVVKVAYSFCQFDIDNVFVLLIEFCCIMLQLKLATGKDIPSPKPIDHLL